MTVVELLYQLRELDVKLWIEADQLRYNAPTGALTPDLRAKLVAQKKEILTFLSEVTTASAGAAPALRPVARNGALPLSFAQQRLWLLDQLTPGSSAYNIPAAVRLTGPLDVAALEQSLSAIVRRHEAVRTYFSAVDGQPLQLVLPPWQVSLPATDLRTLPADERETMARRLADEEGLRPFDLARGPLMRMALLRLGEQEHMLLVTMHHIIADGWSLGVLIRELATFYEAFCGDTPAPLPDLPVQYADYALWQREWLQSGALDTQLAYWKQQLAGDFSTLELPLARPRPSVPTYQGARLKLTLSHAFSTTLQALSQREGVTLFMTLLAAFQIVLSRYVGQDDIVIGSPVAGRTRSEVEGLIGCFLNTLVLRTDLSDNPTFRELLTRVRTTTVGSYAHQDMPFEKLLEELEPKRDTQHAPLFRIFFNMLSFPFEEIKLRSLTTEVLMPPDIGAKFDITLYVDARGEEILFELVYNAALFEQDRMIALLEQLQYVLSQVVENPEARIMSLSLVTPTAQACLPNPTAALDVNWTEAVHTRISQQARRVPTAPAVMDSNESWTYAELDAWSNRIANYLIAQGIRPRDLVAIYAHRSAALVGAVLGVLKAGAAFVVLDPAYPPARLIAAMQVVSPRGWLQLAAADALPYALESFVATTCVCRLELPAQIAAEADAPLGMYAPDDPQVVIGPDNLAYIAFTSGSTGGPKAIAGTHRPLSHFLQWHTQTFDLSESDRFSLLSGLAHDPLLRDLFTPLWLGATLYIPDPEQISYPGWLADWMQYEAISVAHLTPAVAQLLVEAAENETRLALRYAFFGGDVLTRRDVARIRSLAPSVTCVNFYGATETPQAMGYYIVSDQPDQTPVDRSSEAELWEHIPLGRGIADVQLLLLNAAQQLAGVGELGEIYVRTPYLSLGYLGDTAATQEQFLTNPFTTTSAPGDRMYKTGDLGRYLPDGTVAFYGRSDQQVKVRGFRVELDEIRAALSKHPAVRESVVIVREDRPGDKELVAYIVPNREQSTIGALHRFLGMRLPPHMVPSAFVLLERLPLTPNGKLDHRALPAPDQNHPELDEVFAAPRSLTEAALLGIWTDVLGLAGIGIHDNFFELGGHPLLATQVLARVRDTFQVEVPLFRLFEIPTIAGLAESITTIQQTQQTTQLPCLRPSAREAAAPVSFAQQRMWLLNQLEPASPAYTIPTLLRLTGQLDLPALELALTEIVRRHEVLRTSFAVSEEQLVQLIAPAQPISFAVLRLLEVAEAQREGQVQEYVAAQVHTPFDLAHGSLLRISLLELADDEHILVLIMHHIVVDGWSVEVLMRELAALYEAHVTGRPSPLPELSLQYADFARWQRQWLQSAVLETQLAYWRAQLGDDLPVLDLPTDYPRPAVQLTRGAKQSLVVSATLTESLKALSRQHDVTLFMTFLAAFQTLLHRYTGLDDIVVGTPIAGRNYPETEGLIGCFVNTLALRTDLSHNPSFQELLRRVRKMVLEAQAQQDLPFERLVEELQPERDLSRSPIFDVLLNFGNLPRALVTSTELTFSFLEPIEQEAKYAMTLHVEEQNSELHLKLIYQQALFSAEHIACVLSQLKYLLEQIVVAPEKPIRSYSLVTPESRPLLPDPSIVLPEPRYELITSMFLSWAKRTPEQAAVCGDNRTWSYGELAERAHTLAIAVTTHGVERGDVVGVFGSRSFGLIASMLGVFFSGSVLLLLDRTLPSARHRLMIEEAQASLVLYLGDRRPEDAWLQEMPHVNVLQVDRDEGWVIDMEMRPDEAAHLPELAPDDAAYIFFTSGTSGVPKGVIGCHKGLSHFLDWQRKTFAIRPEDRSAQLTNLSFDVVLRDILLPLTSGATLCLPEDGAPLVPGYVISWLQRQQISLLHTVPSLAQSWLTNVPPGASETSMRWMFFAGEPLTDVLVRRWRNTFSKSCGIVNLYGPTETTLAKCFYQVTETIRPGVQPVGWPLPETQALVLTEDDQLCGIGEPGEIVIRTPFRTLGYINTAHEHRKRFAKNPFCDDEQDLLYWTGDRGCYHPDGSLAILGRLDHQIKIRGVRVEPGEIEALLNQHPAVSAAVVVVREDAIGDKRLIAYIVSHHKQAPSTSELHAFLRAKLPEYMVPGAFMVLERLPLTPNGKLDHRALPAPEQNRPELDEVFAAPRTPTEVALLGIWTDVLGLAGIGIHDNFFELGGHSLLATQVLARVRDTFQVEVPLFRLFEIPTIAGLAESIAAVQQTQQTAQLPCLHPSAPAAAAPASFAQQRMWLLNQLEPASPAYTVPTLLRLTGPLDLPALELALTEIVRRHEVLRTSFAVSEEQLLQLIAPAQPISLTTVRLAEPAEAQREGQVQEYVAAQVHTPFDLAHGPLLRISLLELADDEHILVLIMHHIVVDGWSVEVLMRELAALYEARVNGRPSPLQELSLQYADFARWQRQWLQGAVLETQLAYWRQQLLDAPAALNLPIDHPRPATQTFHGARYPFVLPRPCAAALGRLSQREGVTLFMMLLAAFNVLLYRYTGQDDIVLGTPIAGRTRTDIEPLIGFFVNTLVLRTSLAGNPTFLEVLRRVRETTLNAYMHQDLPFEKLVEELQPTRDLSRAPLFQVMFILQNVLPPSQQLPDLKLQLLGVDTHTAQFDLTLVLSETLEGIAGRFEYNTDLFDAATIGRMAGQLQTLLEGIALRPEQPLACLPLLTTAEQDQLLNGWNATAVEYPQAETLLDLIAAQVEQRPEAIALVFEGERLSYQELEQRANRLAQYLQARGVGRGARVAICLERSLELVVGLLGVLKAGAAYVPLDPAYPTARREFILADAQVALMLTQERLLGRFEAGATAVVCVDRDAATSERAVGVAPHTAPTLDDLAYVIYTSGSTGTPKGVMVSHRALLNLLCAMTRQPGCTMHDTLLAVTTFSFDIAALELFLPLLVGAQLIIAPDAAQADAVALQALLSQTNTTIMQATPLTWRLLLEANWPGASDLTILCGGEPLPPNLVAPLQAYCAALWNMYGPTETTIWSITHRVTASADPVPIGRPIANTQCYLLDAALQPVPIGVAGELYIGGDGLALGYLHRPDLTAERFIPNPFGTMNDEGRTMKGTEGDSSLIVDRSSFGTRLYKTGDMARYLPNGTLVYLSRNDNQVKIRGYRIELGEIEHVLLQHPAVQAAVVASYDRPTADGLGDPQLVAYVVPRTVQPLPIAELRDWLQHQLPRYMTPAFFVVLETLPRTPNGKLDRRALPAPDLNEGAHERALIVPRTPIEELLISIWTQVLRLDAISIYDNFFDLGGHSLLATQVLSRIRATFQIELPLRALFETPTVAALARAIQAVREPARESHAEPAITRRKPNQDPPLSFAQQRLWFLQQLEPTSTVYLLPAALRLSGVLDIAALEQSLNAVIRRHEILRTRFTTDEQEPRQIIEPRLALKLAVSDLSALEAAARERSVQERISAEGRQPFDFVQGPLIRASVLRLTPREHILLITLHHAIADGWSIRILSDELAVPYQAFSRGEAARLPELPIQYADFAVWQQQWFQGERLRDQLAYWKRRLHQAPPILTLPTDRPRPAVQTFQGAKQPVVLSRQLTEALHILSRQTNVTFFMMLLAAFKALLGWYTGQQDIVIGTDIANRNLAETEELIGFFVNQLVLRTDLADDPTFEELVIRVREMALEAYEHQDLPFDMLVKALNPQRDASRSPLFQVKFVLQNQPRWTTKLPDLKLSLLEFDAAVAQVDLLLVLTETPQGLVGAVEYSTDLFDAATIVRMVGHFEALLQHVVAQPDCQLSALYTFLNERNRQEQRVQQRDFQALRTKKFKETKPKPVSSNSK